MADRVRELLPNDSGAAQRRRSGAGADMRRQQGPSRSQGGSGPGPAPSLPDGSQAPSGPRWPPPPSWPQPQQPVLQQQEHQQEQQQEQQAVTANPWLQQPSNSNGTAAAVSSQLTTPAPPFSANAYSPAGTSGGFGSGFAAGTGTGATTTGAGQSLNPRQLFTTPESTRVKFDALQLRSGGGGGGAYVANGPVARGISSGGGGRPIFGGVTPGTSAVGPGPPRPGPAGAAAAAQPFRPSATPTLTWGRHGGGGGGAAAAAAAVATGGRAGGSGSAAGTGAAGMGFGLGLGRGPTPAATGRVAAVAPQWQPGLPFASSLVVGLRELSTGAITTGDELRRLQQTWEEARRAQASAAGASHTIEQGGFLGDEEDEAEGRVTAAAAEARAVQDKVRSVLAAAVRTASQPPAAAAAATAAAKPAAATARGALAAAEAAVGGREVVEAKLAAHEAEVRRLRRQAEAQLAASVEAAKAAEERRRAEAEAQRRVSAQRAPHPPPAPGGATAAATVAHAPAQRQRLPPAAAVAPGRRPPQQQAAKPAGKPAPKPAAGDDEVMDLVSSDEEGEEEEDQQEEEEDRQEEGEGAEDDGGGNDPYAVPYGMYGDERRGRGNPALAAASARERSSWRRLFDPGCRKDEVMLSFSPNTATDIKLPREKLLCLASREWLNDEVINLYMLLLQDRDARLRGPGGSPGPSGAPRCHFFNSFFYNKLFSDENAYNYKNVRRWTGPARLKNNLQASPGLLGLDRIIMPIHKGVHWTCAVIDLRDKAVRYYDSLKGEDRACLEHLLRWLADESEDKLKTRWDTSSWRLEFPKRIPEQRNGCDCGVFSIMFADRLGAGRPLDFSQADMELLRVKVLHRLMRLRVD